MRKIKLNKMFELILLIGIVILLILLLFGGKYLHEYLYPERKLKNILSGTTLTNSGFKGADGFHGKDGNLNPIAINGINGTLGVKGANGTNGNHVLIPGKKGSLGDTGRRGIHGTPGNSGSQGLPSNSSIPIVQYLTGNDQNNIPLIYEHYFTYKDQIHKLTASFIFDEITRFSFQNGENNTVYQIKTNTDYFNHVVLPDLNVKIRKVYSTIRLVIEDTESIFYTSSPISRDGYIITSINSLFNVVNIEEILIEKYREFGLDFELEKAPVSDPYTFNYTVGGIAIYRVILNIDPPISKCIARIEETYSSQEITDFYVPKIKHPSNDGITKIKGTNSIYVLSQGFPFGRVVFKDLSFTKGLWRLQNFKSLSESLEDSFPLVIKGLNHLESTNFSFRDGLRNVNSLLLASTIDPQPLNTFQDLAFSFKGNMGAPFATKPLYASIFNNFSLTGQLYENHDAFSTRMKLYNLQLQYPNESIQLSYPSELNNSFFYLFFIVKVHRKNFENKRYVVQVNALDPITVNDDNGQLVLHTLFDGDSLFTGIATNITINFEDDYIYHPVKINLYNGVPFEKIFGKRVILKFSLTKLEFESHYGDINNYDESFRNPPYFTASSYFTGRNQSSKTAFDGSNTIYDFDPSNTDVCHYYDFLFSVNKFEVESNIFLVGYEQTVGNPKFQRVIGYPLSNGDYYLDIPVCGY